jgi:hypothetical protein
MKWKSFPVDALPSPVARFVREGAAAIGCDPTYIGLPLLAALGSAIGNTRRIRLKASWAEPAVLWCAIVGDSGTLKSPALELALRQVHEQQKRLNKDHLGVRATNLRERREWKSQPQRERGPEPESPQPLEHVYCSDVTVEALADRLQASPRGVLVAVDELAGWFGGFNQYKGANGSDVPAWLSMHRAGTLKVDRKTGEQPTILVPHAAVSITGSIQVGILRRVLAEEYFDNGLAARLLLAMPPPRVRRWTDAEISGHAQDAMRKVFQSLYSLRPHADGHDWMPLDLGLTNDAKATWIQFYDEHAKELAQLESAELVAAFSKLEGYAARLALIIHCVRQVHGEDVDPLHVDEESVSAGIAIARWFAYETQRVYAEISETQGDAAQRKLIGWIRVRGGCVSVRDVMRGLRAYRDNYDEAEGALQDLVNAGKGEWYPASNDGPGRPQSKMFRLYDADDSDDA